MHIKESLSFIRPFSQGLHYHKKTVTEITTSYYVLMLYFLIQVQFSPVWPFHPLYLLFII